MPRHGPTTPRVTPSQAQQRFVARLLRSAGWSAGGPAQPTPAGDAAQPQLRDGPAAAAPTNGDATNRPPSGARRERPGSIPPFVPRDPASPFHGDGVLRELVRSVLAYNAGERRAQEDLHAIASGVVDVNELRVCTREEIAELLTGPEPERPARAELLRAALGEVFKREQRLALDHLPEMEEAGRAFLQTLGPPALPAYVSDRLSVLALGLPGVAIDDRIAARLRQARLARQAAGNAQIAAELLALVPDGAWAALQQELERWADSQTPRDAGPPSRPKPRSSGRAQPRTPKPPRSRRRGTR
ncbi:MAG: hypothetical protein C0475_00490 [Planctomyces sp.]|nr:hypothetical protein [Planctomyces sp.]